MLRLFTHATLCRSFSHSGLSVSSLLLRRKLSTIKPDETNKSKSEEEEDPYHRKDSAKANAKAFPTPMLEERDYGKTEEEIRIMDEWKLKEFPLVVIFLALCGLKILKDGFYAACNMKLYFEDKDDPTRLWNEAVEEAFNWALKDPRVVQVLGGPAQIDLTEANKSFVLNKAKVYLAYFAWTMDLEDPERYSVYGLQRIARADMLYLKQFEHIPVPIDLPSPYSMFPTIRAPAVIGYKEYQTTLKGPSGSATIKLAAYTHYGKWALKHCEVVDKDDKKIIGIVKDHQIAGISDKYYHIVK